ncbi:MAG: Na+/H+ antiporter subunit A [Gordonia sp. (in: high G+C Gram-positive bacteria)]|uniref:Na+/H+ antiporter subunit A n=1 Tax=Gordonia sp. (in: high G+C Gram-positive bacteria) TaxID=84139 RepID=UPI0039E36853
MIATLSALMVAALVAPAVMWRLGPKGFYLISLAPLAALGWVIAHWPKAGHPVTETVDWVPRLGMNLDFRMDTLAAVLSVLILGIGALVLVYCANYFDAMRPRVAVFGGEMLAFAASMFGLVISDNTLVLYVFWEITTILSFLLVGFYGVRASSRRAATQALLVTTLGGLAMLAGIIMLGTKTGSYDLSDWLAAKPTGTYVDIAIAAILVGALSKSAIVPLHFWLPGAMAAPTPVSAYLHAAAMVKAGVYLVARLAPGFATLPVWQVLVVGLGALTMLVGGWRSLRELDLKLVLAYGTVSQLGFLMILVGFGDANVALAGLAMLCAHALFKAALFMVVGIIDHSTGTRDLRKLARLGQKMPVLAGISAIAAASMAGLPFTLGFVGKETAFGTVWASGAMVTWQARVTDVVLLVGAIITMAYTTRFLWGAFGRKVREAPSLAVQRAHRPHPMFLAPPAILAAAGVVGGFVSGWLGSIFEPYADTLPTWGHAIEHLGMWHGFGLPVVFSAIVIVAGVLAFLSVRALRDHLFVRPPVISANDAYDAVLRTVDSLSLRITRTTQRGSLPITQGVILATAVVAPMAALFTGARSAIHPTGFDAPTQAVVSLVMLAAALGVAVLRNRLAAVIAIGLNGYGCVYLFARHGAPDLALTQALVETLTLVIFVLVLRKLPAESPWRRPTGLTNVVRIVIAAAVGSSVVVMGLFAAAARSSKPLHEIIPDLAYRIGHGSNSVNVLLVDIRAWDTLGEVSVLIVAATGVASMVFRNRRFGAAPRVADVAADGDGLPQDRTTWLRGSDLRDPRHRSLVLEATTRLVFPTMMVLSVFLFYAGHNSPGGGFAGGLVMGLALVLRYLAGGRYELGEALPIEAGTILGTGLAISGGTAVTSLFLGAPALSSAVIEITLPLLGQIHLVTAMFFDLGIYLIVVGLVLDILRSLGARLDVEDEAVSR